MSDGRGCLRGGRARNHGQSRATQPLPARNTPAAVSRRSRRRRGRGTARGSTRAGPGPGSSARRTAARPDRPRTSCRRRRPSNTARPSPGIGAMPACSAHREAQAEAVARRQQVGRRPVMAPRWSAVISSIGLAAEQAGAVRACRCSASSAGSGRSPSRWPTMPPPPDSNSGGWRTSSSATSAPVRGPSRRPRRGGRDARPGTWKPLSVMPSGARMRSCRNVPRRLAGDHLDQPAQHVGRAAVFPARAGLVQQRQAGQCRPT